MPERNNTSGKESGMRRQRRRLRGMMNSKTGKTIGLASIAAPVIGYVVNDLKKPDSVIRALLQHTVRKILPGSTSKVEAIDISDRVEIIEDKSADNN